MTKDDQIRIASDNTNWDEDDVKVGGWMILFTVILLLVCTGSLVVMGYNRWPLFGWPLLIGVVFVGLRIVKGRLRQTLTEAEIVVDHANNVFDEKTPEEGLSQHRKSTLKELVSSMFLRLPSSEARSFMPS